jgi:hypothetical protein
MPHQTFATTPPKCPGISQRPSEAPDLACLQQASSVDLAASVTFLLGAFTILQHPCLHLQHQAELAVA